MAWRKCVDASVVLTIEGNGNVFCDFDDPDVAENDDSLGDFESFAVIMAPTPGR